MMASPVAVRQPLAQRNINTPSFYPPSIDTTTTTAKHAAATVGNIKSIAGQKRSHTQIATGQENTIVCAGFKSPSRGEIQQQQTLVQLKQSGANSSHIKPIVHAQPLHQFKKPLQPTNSTDAKARQRQPAQNHENHGRDKEMDEWRKCMRRTISTSTFYFDGIEEGFKDQASRWLNRHGGKVEQFFSNSVNIIITQREVPQQKALRSQPSEPTTKPVSKPESHAKNLHPVGSRSLPPPPVSPPQQQEQQQQQQQQQPVKDILLRARELGMKIWSIDKFKRILQCISSPSSTPSSQSQPQTANPLRLSAALQAEKRQGRTTETDPSVPREEYVYLKGPYILVTDLANVHKPIMVREYPVGSDRSDALWPMFWAGKEGSCPFVRPKPQRQQQDATPIPPTQKHYARPNVSVLTENKQVTNRPLLVPEQPASGIINSSNAFSAIRSTTTCGSKSTNVTSALGGLGGGINLSGSLSRQVRDLKTRLTPAIEPVKSTFATADNDRAMNPPPMKKRKVEPLKVQPAQTKKEKHEGYCENCKEQYDDYDDHTQSRRHRKYARNPKNFVDLDTLLDELARPMIDQENIRDYKLIAGN